MSKEIVVIWYGLFMSSLALFFVLALDPWQPSGRVTITRLPPDAHDVYGSGESTRRAAMLDRCILQMGSEPCDRLFGLE